MGFDVYIRGGLGEAWAFSLLPLLFWSFYKITVQKKILYVFLAALSLATIILSHNLTAYITIPFLFLWVI